jgi:uncharacterized protein YjdB
MAYLFKLTRRLAHSKAALLLAAAAACSGDYQSPTLSGPAAGPSASRSAPSSISISPSTATGSLGQSAQFVAIVRDASGYILKNQAVVWTSTDSTIAAITSSGYATAVGVGSASLVATVGSLSARAPVSVTGVPLAKIVLSPTTINGFVGQAGRVAAALYDSAGNPLSGRRLLWSSSNPAIVKVDTLGNATAIAPGSAAINVLSAGVTASSQVNVTSAPPGTVSDLAVASANDTSVTLTFTQVGDGLGNPANYQVRYAPAPISWGSATPVASGTCAKPPVTSVGSALSCTVLGLSSGTTYNFQLVSYRGTLDVNAVFGGLSNVATGVTSTPQAVPASVSVSPSSLSVPVGSTGQLAATVKDANGNVLPNSCVTWSSSNTAIATVSTGGLVTGVAAGSANVVANCQGKTALAAVTVTALVQSPPPPPTPVATTIAVSPLSGAVTVGGTQQFAATVKDQNGNVMSGLTISWSSSNSAVASVNASGLATGVSAGSATIKAAYGTLSASASLSVAAPAPVATTISVSPASASVTVGATQQLGAVVKDQNGNAMSGLSITWKSANTAVATVNSSGLVTGVAAGSTTITGSYGSLSASSSITVSAPAAPPPPPSTAEPMPSGKVIWQDGFEGYSSGTNILSTYTHLNGESKVSLDATGGYSGSKAMRIDWPQQASGCTDDDHLIEQGFSAAPEIYAQYYVRYQAGFIFDWNGQGGCSGNAKKLFLMPGGTGSRLDLISENHHIVLYEDHIGYASGLQNVGTEFTPEMLGDGNWHRITLHARLSSSAGANDGIIEGWIDGVKHWSLPNPVSGVGYQYFQTPTVFNQGSPKAQSEWMDNLVVWKP